MAHHKLLVLGLTAVNELCDYIVCVLDNIIVFIYQRLYNILYLMISFWFLSGFYERILLHLFYTMYYM